MRTRFAAVLAAAFFLTAVPALSQSPELPAPTSAPVVAVPQQVTAPGPPAATQNTITTSGPVSSSTTISTGSLAAQVLDWAVAAFGGTLTWFGVQLLRKLVAKAGVELTAGMSAQLNETLLNGLNAAAERAETAMAGKGVVDVKTQVIADAISYAQAHRAETIQKLGLDPTSGKAVLALKARIATLINDPTVATPAVLGGPTPTPLLQTPPAANVAPTVT